MAVHPRRRCKKALRTPTRRHVLAGTGAMVTAAMLPSPRLGATPSRTIRPQVTTLKIANTDIGDVVLDAWAYNGMVPGPLLRYTRGDRLDIMLDNALPEPTSLHWHGLRVPNAMDGAPPLTQDDVLPGETFHYQFDLKDAGTYWYHTHTRGWNQQDRGLYGPLIVDETNPLPVDRELLLVIDDWLVEQDGSIDPARFGNMHDWAHAGRLGSLVTVNSEDQPAFKIHRGERLRVRMLNVANAQIFVPVFDGHDPWLVAQDGDPVPPRRVGEDPVVLGPGQRADYILDATGEAGSVHDVRAYTLTGDAPIATLSYSDRAAATRGLAGTEVSALEPNDRPLPDLANARRVPLILEGGAMGQMRSAMLGGREMGFRELIANRRVWALNGVAGDMSEPMLRLSRGETAVMDIDNQTRWPHSIHLHGMHFTTLSRNGSPVSEGYRDTITLNRGDKAKIAFVAETPGKWMLHCHMIEHQVSGMMGWIEIR